MTKKKKKKKCPNGKKIVVIFVQNRYITYLIIAMNRSTQVHFFLGFLLALNIAINGWAITRGLLFVAETDVPGLKLQKHALAFTKTLLSRIYFNVLSQNNLNVKFPTRIFYFNYSVLFPAPNSASLIYNTDVVDIWIKNQQYVSRCVKLNDIIPPDNIFFYGNILMHPNGTGLRGSLCQERFHFPNAYARIDNLCDGLACMHDQQLLGCIHRNHFSQYYIQDCARPNNKQKGLHWSTNGQTNITLDNDPNMRLPI